MDIPKEILGLLRCPTCAHELTAVEGGLSCCGPDKHRISEEDGFLTFARPPAGKYDPAYANRYTALWAYGYETRHRGLNESLYRTVSSLIAESLALRAKDASPPIVVDCGCGVGRSTADSALLAATGWVLAVDGSPAMLKIADRVVRGSQQVTIALPEDGFGNLSIAGRGAPNVFLMRADVENLPLADASADVVLSVNIVDRLPNGPDLALEQCLRILRPGGSLVFTDPLNWTRYRLWQDYPDAKSVIEMLRELGFEVDCWFDGLSYREVIDSRESFEELNTLVALARKPLSTR